MFEQRAISDRALGDKIAARVGFQPQRGNINHAVVVQLAMMEIDGKQLATPALDAFLEVLRSE